MLAAALVAVACSGASVKTAGTIAARGRRGLRCRPLCLRGGSEEEWLEGDLGIRNVHLANNTIVDDYGDPTPAGRVDVMGGLENVTCVATTFVESASNSRTRAGSRIAA